MTKKHYVISTFGRTGSKWMHAYFNRFDFVYALHGTTVSNQYSDALEKQDAMEAQESALSSHRYHAYPLDDLFDLVETNAPDNVSRIIHIHGLDAALVKTTVKKHAHACCYVLRKPLDRVVSMASHFQENMDRDNGYFEMYGASLQEELKYYGFKKDEIEADSSDLAVLFALAHTLKMDHAQIHNAVTYNIDIYRYEDIFDFTSEHSPFFEFCLGDGHPVVDLPILKENKKDDYYNHVCEVLGSKRAETVIERVRNNFETYALYQSIGYEGISV